MLMQMQNQQMMQMMQMQMQPSMQTQNQQMMQMQMQPGLQMQTQPELAYAPNAINVVTNPMANNTPVWEERSHPSGRTQYYNTVTHELLWTKPRTVVDMER